MGLNLTLIVNVGAVLLTAAATHAVAQYPLAALGMAFAAGVAVTVSSRYAFHVSTDVSVGVDEE